MPLAEQATSRIGKAACMPLLSMAHILPNILICTYCVHVARARRTQCTSRSARGECHADVSQYGKRPCNTYCASPPMHNKNIQLSLRLVNTASCVILASELSVAHLVCTVIAAPELNFTLLHPLDCAQVQDPNICVCVTVADMNWGYRLRVWFDTCACCLLMVAGYGL